MEVFSSIGLLSIYNSDCHGKNKYPIKFIDKTLLHFLLAPYSTMLEHTSYVFNVIVQEQMYFNGCTKMYTRNDCAKCRKLKWLNIWSCIYIHDLH